MDYTASRTLTLQLYANPFVSRGTYSDVREIVNARVQVAFPAASGSRWPRTVERTA